MARLARLYAPDVPQLVEARFVPAVAGDGALLGRAAHWLAAETRGRPIALHAWVVLPDRLLALATPGDRGGVSRLVQGIGRRLAAETGGAVFAGRYRSALVEPGQWVLPAMLWVEARPSALGLVPDPEHWRLGSVGVHTGAVPAGHLSDHADYWACGNTPFDRQANYRRRLHEGLGSLATQRIEAALHGQWALGQAGFVAMVEAQSRRAAPAPRGRPRKPRALGDTAGDAGV